jgi:hypothetical protein
MDDRDLVVPLHDTDLQQAASRSGPTYLIIPSPTS